MELMSEGQWKRWEVVGRLRAGKLTMAQAALVLALSVRQVRRLRDRVATEGRRALPLAGGGRARGLAPAPAPPSQAPRAQGPGGPDAAVGWEPARLARGARAVAVPGGRDRRRDG